MDLVRARVRDQRHHEEALSGAFARFAGGGGLSNSTYANIVRDKGWRRAPKLTRSQVLWGRTFPHEKTTNEAETARRLVQSARLCAWLLRRYLRWRTSESPNGLPAREFERGLMLRSDRPLAWSRSFVVTAFPGLLLLLIAAPPAGAAEQANGAVKPETVTVLHGDKAVWLNEYAAGELQKYVEQMTGKGAGRFGRRR